jgi:hypothetical protein
MNETVNQIMNQDLLHSIQKYNARVAITSNSMRGAGSAGVVASARTFLGELALAPLGRLAERGLFLFSTLPPRIWFVPFLKVRSVGDWLGRDSISSFAVASTQPTCAMSTT